MRGVGVGTLSGVQGLLNAEKNKCSKQGGGQTAPQISLTQTFVWADRQLSYNLHHIMAEKHADDIEHAVTVSFRAILGLIESFCG